MRFPCAPNGPNHLGVVMQTAPCAPNGPDHLGFFCVLLQTVGRAPLSDDFFSEDYTAFCESVSAPRPQGLPF